MTPHTNTTGHTKMTKSELFTAAHNIARDTVAAVGDYLIAFSLALRGLYRKPQIASVLVKGSESREFGYDEEMSEAEFNTRVARAVEANRAHGRGGYDKTFLVVKYTNGAAYQFRLDIGDRFHTVAEEVHIRAKHYTSKNLSSYHAALQPKELVAFYKWVMA